mgnify:CR=1 FL=1
MTTRRTLLKTSGALFVGIGLAGRESLVPTLEAAGNSLDPSQSSSWFEIHADNTIVMRTGKVDFGQTTAHTAYKQIVAEELNVTFEAITAVVMGDTDLCPFDMGTFGSLSIRVLGPVLRALHDEPRFAFEILMDLCGVDTGEEMQIVYHLASFSSSDWLRVIVAGVDRNAPRVNSLVSLWPGAEWMERETYDFFGIRFAGHPNLKRILNMDEMTDFPLRKEFPLEDPFRHDKADYQVGR